MTTPSQEEKWRRVADLIGQLGLVPNTQDQPRTAAQVARMTTRHLLQDPVRAAIYNRGWADRTADIERRLRPQPSTTASNGSTSRPPRRQPTTAATHRVTTRQEKGPEPQPLREPATVPGPTVAPSTSGTKHRTEAQLARNKKKFQKLKEKRKARESKASQQHRLAKQPAPTSDPGAASEPLPGPDQPVAMEVDGPATKDDRSEEPGRSADQASPNHATATDNLSENAWLEAPGLSLEGLPEVEYDNRSFFTPIGSPKQ